MNIFGFCCQNSDGNGQGVESVQVLPEAMCAALKPVEELKRSSTPKVPSEAGGPALLSSDADGAADMMAKATTEADEEREEAKPPRPEGPMRQTFLLRKKRNHQPWGLNVEMVSGVSNLVLINQVTAGYLQDDYNRSAGPGNYQFERFDLITRVNGTSDARSMAEAVNDNEVGSLEIAIARPRRLTETVNKDGRPLGLTVKHSGDSHALAVKSISEGGAVKASNADLQVGDLIVAINGRFGTAKELMDAMKIGFEMELSILRME